MDKRKKNGIINGCVIILGIVLVFIVGIIIGRGCQRSEHRYSPSSSTHSQSDDSDEKYERWGRAADL